MEKSAVQEISVEVRLPAFAHVCSSSTQSVLKTYVCLACAHEPEQAEHSPQSRLSLRVCGADGDNCGFTVTSWSRLSAEEIQRKFVAFTRRTVGPRRYLSTVQICPDYCHERLYVYSNSSDALDVCFHCGAICVDPCRHGACRAFDGTVMELCHD